MKFITATSILAMSTSALASSQQILTFKSDTINARNGVQIEANPQKMPTGRLNLITNSNERITALEITPPTGKTQRHLISEISSPAGMAIYVQGDKKTGTSYKVVVLHSKDFDSLRGGTIDMEFMRDERPFVGKPHGHLELELKREPNGWQLYWNAQSRTPISQMIFHANFQNVIFYGKIPVGIKKIEIN